MAKTIKVKAPARICLFGDHQDYMGLPVIACAIDRYIYLEATPNNSATFHLNLKDLGTERTIDIVPSKAPLAPRDYYRSGLSVLAREGIIPNRGYDITVSGDIPINAGISSSSALTVAWITFLVKAFGDLSKYTAATIGHLAYLAESVEHNESGGRMDQYTSAIGGVIYIETDQDKNVSQLEIDLPCMIVSESGDTKNTLGGLANLNTKAKEAIAIISEYNAGFSIKKAKNDEIKLQLSMLPDYLHPIYEAAVKNHEITKSVSDSFQLGTLTSPEVGQQMYKHHKLLKDLLKITTPKIDQIVNAAMETGALGAKIIGSGGGGCVCILCDASQKERILAVLNNQVGAKSYEVNLSQGAYTLNL